MNAYQALQHDTHSTFSFNKIGATKPFFLEFFAGSGLVSYALDPFFNLSWANDICTKKGEVFTTNHPGKVFELGSITDVKGKYLPESVLSWASFPCQDLSLAGNAGGIRAKRSGLVWEWLRVMDEMPVRPPLLVAENVVGLVSTKQGKDYRELHKELVARGYVVGAMLLDAVHWLPHSRPRVFIVATLLNKNSIPTNLVSECPTWTHPLTIQRASKGLARWVWWNLPSPPHPQSTTLESLIDFSIPCQDEATSHRNLEMLPTTHWQRLQKSGRTVVPGYKRMRQGKQVLELRFDGNLGCLRTPSGGSSRQYLVIKCGNSWRTRILSPLEAARFMGAPRNYKLPNSFNAGYKAMGDAVAVPVVQFLAKHLLVKLAQFQTRGDTYGHTTRT